MMSNQINFKVKIYGKNLTLTITRSAQSTRSGVPTSSNPKFEVCCDNLKVYVFD